MLLISMRSKNGPVYFIVTLSAAFPNAESLLLGHTELSVTSRGRRAQAAARRLDILYQLGRRTK